MTNETLTNLILLYLSALVINLIISLLLWWKNRDSTLYRLLCLLWATFVLAFVAQGATAESTSPIAITLSFSTLGFSIFVAARLLYTACGETLRPTPYVAGPATGITLSLLASAAGQSFLVVSAPAALGLSAPLLFDIIRLIRRRFHELTLSQRGFAISGIFTALHLLDFPFLRDKPEFATLGFTIAILLVLIYSVFSPAIAMELMARKAARVESERRALEKDLEVTKAVQSLLLPQARDFRRGPVNGTWYYQAASQSGGDWLWHEELEDRSRLILGDVTGHGPGSAMITAAMASSYATQRLLGGELDRQAMISRLHQVLVSVAKGSYNMTLAIFEISPSANEFTFWNAGGPALLVARPDKGVEIVIGRSTPLGGETFGVFQKTIPFPAGSRLLAFTDGLIENTGPDGTPLGLRGLKNLFSKTLDSPLANLHDALLAQVESSRKSGIVEDDVAFILAEYSHS